MDQNWFYRGDELIHSLSEQETTSYSVAVWRIGQCGVFLKYNGKIILIDPVLEPIYGTDDAVALISVTGEKTSFFLSKGF